MTPAPKPWYADWTQYICPGPRRRFSPEEMARAGQQPWPRGVDLYVLLSVAFISATGLALAPRPMVFAGMVATQMGLALLALWATHRLWRHPTRLRLNTSTQVSSLIFLALVFGLDQLALERPMRKALQLEFMVLFMMTVTAWWFLVLYRVQQIDARLAELDAHDERLRLTRRLATAQIHPHFVFNTLASLTHWVESGDARAAPLLKEFNAYLRATLPMFEREQQALREELDLVRHYLAIMKARLGERLDWTVTADPALHELPLPPGSLLTLVENAITHGIEPSLRGGRIDVQAARDGTVARITVRDTGTGLDTSAGEGLGLSNTRERLIALHPAARQVLAPLDEGGCIAALEIPL